MDLSLENQVVVITGGAGLIGSKFAEAVAECRGVAIIADSNQQRALDLSRRLEGALHIRPDCLSVDITDKESLVALIQAVHKKYGRIDALVNSAFPRNENYNRHFFDVEYEDFCFHLNMNVGGYFLASQQFAKYFKEQGRGNIINIGSIYGVVPPRFEIYRGTEMTSAVEYAAIKSAIIHLTKYLAKYLAGSNIRVNCLSPGGVRDNHSEVFLRQYREQTLNQGMLLPEDLKGTLIYLLSDLSRAVNGQNIVVDDGFVL